MYLTDCPLSFRRQRRQLTNLTEVHEQISGMARCPYSPRHNSTVLLTASGELYAATAMDFSGRDPAIYRSLGGLPPLRTAQYNSKWLNGEGRGGAMGGALRLARNAVEQDCGRTVFSRVARVCKNDVGGRFLLEDTWTTFMKARLNCSRPGDVPFYYSELQGTFFLPRQGLLYAIFTTNVNSIAASAVCVFNLSAINQVFRGPFRYQENSRSAWLPYPNPNPDFQCGTIDYGSYINLTERNLQDAQKFLLMHEVVQPSTPLPRYLEDSVRFSHVVVDVVRGRDQVFHIIYLATDYGTIRKVLAPLNRSHSSCVLDEIKLFPPRKSQPIRSLLIQPGRGVLFVGIRDQVIRVQLKRCSFHGTREACVGARDPYCGWDLALKRCTTLEESRTISQWEQSITECPRRNVTVDGGFGPWSGWRPCGHSDEGEAGSCLCRTRSCDNPSPQCGGRQCAGVSVEVANCSRNGAWTPWSPWVPCSTSCGIGFQVRQRACSNPAPLHGGRICVGQGREERYVCFAPRHPKTRSEVLQRAPPLSTERLLVRLVAMGTLLGALRRGSSVTATDMRERERVSRLRPETQAATCLHWAPFTPHTPQKEEMNWVPPPIAFSPALPTTFPLPRSLAGSEFQSCNSFPCPDLKKTTPWTPWAPVNISDHGGHYEQRFRYTCKASVPDPALLEVGRQRIEMRYCSNDGCERIEKYPAVSQATGMGRGMVGLGGVQTDMVGEAWDVTVYLQRATPHRFLGDLIKLLPPGSLSWQRGRGAMSSPGIQVSDSLSPSSPVSPGDLLRSSRLALPAVNGGWSPWGSWAQCSRDCGGGIRSRKRVCSSPEVRYGGVPCLGPALEYQECNINPCPGERLQTGAAECANPWSCSPPAAYGGDICLGLHTEEALCNTQPCPESWSPWSRWSQCEPTGVQVRVRHCDALFPTGNQCSGNSTESRACTSDSNLIPESIAHSSLEKRPCEDFNWFHMLAVGLSSSILGCLSTLLIYTYCQRYQQQSHDATVIHPVTAAPLNTSVTSHNNKLDKYDSVAAIKVSCSAGEKGVLGRESIAQKPDVSVLLPTDDHSMCPPLASKIGAS
ncbi:hypothetical protein JZ751_000987, partial [Albula glossodonta]